MPRVAIAQSPGTRLEQWPETLESTLSLVRAAAERSAEILVLPECVWPAYHLGSREAWASAVTAGMPPQDVLLEALTRAARTRGLTICCGYVAANGDRLYNRACLIDRRGELLGTYDKCFLWDFDRRWFTPGAEIRPFNTEFGPVGIMICADARLPEIPATLVCRGAKLILQPTAWVNAGSPDRPWNPQADFLIAARAAEFGVPIASASKWGCEHDTTFVGSSLICDARGRVLAQATQAETCVLTADVELARNPRVRITERERSALLSPEAPVRPPAVGRALLTLARCGTLEMELLPREQAQQSRAELAQTREPTSEPVRPVGLGRLQLGGPLVGVIRLGRAAVGSVSDQEASRFAPIRVLALAGVHLVAVWGNRVNDAVVRTRAAENRVLVAHARPEGLTVYSPTGRPVVPAGNPPESPVELDLDAAIDKHVAWRTDVLAGRTPEMYDF